MGFSLSDPKPCRILHQGARKSAARRWLFSAYGRWLLSLSNEWRWWGCHWVILVITVYWIHILSLFQFLGYSHVEDATGSDVCNMQRLWTRIFGCSKKTNFPQNSQQQLSTSPSSINNYQHLSTTINYLLADQQLSTSPSSGSDHPHVSAAPCSGWRRPSPRDPGDETHRGKWLLNTSNTNGKSPFYHQKNKFLWVVEKYYTIYFHKIS